ncbi:MAG: hypothetical protein IKL25_08315 [Clostridia bacterium]|nr:hypothetical protein [Clostridia bacterium]
MKKMLLTGFFALVFVFLASSALAEPLCPLCGEPATGRFGLLSGGKDVHAPYCTNCNAIVNNPSLFVECTPLENSATCTTPARCSICGKYMYSSSEKDPNAHNMDLWYSNADGTHTRICRQGCGLAETESCSGGTATCAQPAICTVCHSFYGKALSEHSNMSDWRLYDSTQHSRYCKDCRIYEEYANHTSSTTVCGTLPTCDICGETYGISTATVHWYLDWASNGDGTHSARCRRTSCGYERTVPCESFILQQDDASLAICPVCGDAGEKGFDTIAGASAATNALPILGEVVIRGLEAPVDGALYAFTVAWEVGGRTMPFPTGTVVSLPVTAEGFTLQHTGDSPADVPFTLENGVLTFATDDAGIFFLLPAQQ